VTGDGGGSAARLKPLALWECFEWRLGSCFKCEAVGVPVALVGALGLEGAREVPLHACHPCVFRLQQRHWALTGRPAWRTPAHADTEPPPGVPRGRHRRRRFPGWEGRRGVTPP
jgi:hypothetical protein